MVQKHLLSSLVAWRDLAVVKTHAGVARADLRLRRERLIQRRSIRHGTAGYSRFPLRMLFWRENLKVSGIEEQFKHADDQARNIDRTLAAKIVNVGIDPGFD